jgi:hypothetical protein
MAVGPPVGSALYTPGKGSMLPIRTLASFRTKSLRKSMK